MRKLVSTKMRKNGILLKQFREDKINRNILYCKFDNSTLNKLQEDRINRNILYCKFIPKGSYFSNLLY